MDIHTATEQAYKNGYAKGYADALGGARKLMVEAPTADVVEVVRCKDCKHYKPYAKPVEDFDGECIVRECETDENDFCSYGKRKDKKC